MYKSELIACFQDTLAMAESNSLRDKTIRAQKSNKVYREGFTTDVPKLNKEHSSINVEANTTFAAAKKYSFLGRTAVLNFANPQIPGGGVQAGAMAQEECLCRSSNLYSCIADENVFAEYYARHINANNPFYSDRLIYTRDVTVFKDDNDVPQLLPESEWFAVDVITCAAPYWADRKYTDLTALLALFKGRIKNIFEAARDNGADVIILGAFGCGAFKNPPEIVAEAFRQVIFEQNYFACLKQIVFAIKPTGKNCPNLTAFKKMFAEYIPDVRHEFVEFTAWKNGVEYRTYGFFAPTYHWDPSRMRAEDMECFTVSFGDLPIVKITYDGGKLSVVNKINGSRDGWMHFPDGFFDEKTIELSNGQNAAIADYMKMIGFCNWITDEKLQENYENGACGFCIANSFSCVFKNGTKFRCLEPPKQDFENLIGFLKSFCGAGCFTELHEENGLFQGQDLPAEKYDADAEYVFLPKNTTSILYVDTIKLFDMDRNQEIEISKVKFDAGRSPECELKIEGSSISKIHASFYYENSSWFIMDNYSLNGVWLNDNRLEPHKKYELCMDDMISFARAKTYVFYKSKYFSKYDPFGENPDYIMPELPADEKAPNTGSVINGRYELLKPIGEGGTFKVYLAVDNVANMQYAVKVSRSDCYANFDFARNSAIQEAEMLKILNHPAVPRISDIIVKPGYVAIVQEYVEGETLEHIVGTRGPQTPKAVAGWAKQLCNFLGYLHTLNPPHIYRDMKPGNLILEPNGNIKIIDFGLLHAYGPGQDSDDYCLGTRGYAAPEQFGRLQMDPRTDIYGLGMTMYHLITGIDPKKPPYAIKTIRQAAPYLPKDLEYIITKCIQINPDDRYQSCEELLADLDNYKNLPASENIVKRFFKRNKR